MRQGTTSIALAGAILAAACEPAPLDKPIARSEALQAPSRGLGSPDDLPLPLAVSLNETMVALVDFAADGVWRPAASETPLTDTQWALIDQNAVNLIAAASLITMKGQGVNDEVWIVNPDWRRWSLEMQATAAQVRSAVTTRDQERLRLAGDRLVEICQTCHQAFKPGLPSMGVTRFPVYPKPSTN
jgi:hypothetical protein